jgi:PAS domain S-box-containing protein
MTDTSATLAQLHGEVDMLRQRLAVLEDVNRDIARELDPTVLLQLIAEKVATFLDATMAGISLWNPTLQVLEIGVLHGPLTWLWTTRIRLGEGLTGEVAEQRRGLRVDDYQQYPNAIPTFRPRFGPASLMAEPIVYQERLLGVITVGRQAPVRPFTDAEQALLATVASQVAVALENARLFQEVQQREARYRALVEGSVQGLSIIDQRGYRVFANLPLARMLGYERPEELLGQHVLDGIVPEDRERLRQHNTQGAQAHATPGRYEYRRLKKDGTAVWLAQTVTPITWEGQPAHLMTSADITRRVHLEEQLREYLEQLEILVEARAQRIRDLEHQRMAMEKLAATAQIAAGMAHEINNPLAGMKNALFLVKDTIPPGHQSAAYMELIEREITRLTIIVRQMYELYAPIAAPAQPCCVTTLVQEVYARLARHSQERQVTLRWAPPVDVPPLLLMEAYCLQVLSNLVKNAIQASPPQAEVVLTAQYDGTQLSVQVTDHGSGIAPEHRPRLFEPFFTTKHGGDQVGMGLGLSISQTLATIMGGRIDVTTEPGQGSTFTLVIPCTAADVGCPPSAQSA